MSGIGPGDEVKYTRACATGCPAASSTVPAMVRADQACAIYAFHATMLLYTGVTIRVPEFVVAPPYAWIANA